MTDQLKQIIKDEMAKLPKENQIAIGALNWEKITEEIGKKFFLQEDEINTLQTETFLILIGLEEPDAYAENVEENVGTSKDQASKIVEEMAQKVFIPISDILIESIKKRVVNKNTSWMQNLDFILSGGDFSSFVVPARRIETEIEPEKTKELPKMPLAKKIPIIPTPLTATPTLADIKLNTERTNIPVKPKAPQL